MLDIKLIRENPKIIKQDLKKRDDKEKLGLVDELLKKDEDFRKLTYSLQELVHKKNTLSKDIAQLRKEGQDIKGKIAELKNLPKRVQDGQQKLQQIKEEISAIMQLLPNILHDSVPVGKTEEDNKTVRKHGTIKKPTFELKSHVDLLESLNLADMERAAKVAGARFYYLKNELVLMDLALQKFALELLSKKGFDIMEVPLMINKKAISGAVQLSDFEDDIYKIEDEDLYMIGTSEHSLACFHMDETLSPDSLPLKYAGVSSCFRKEAGSHGKDTKGIFRVHQFNKVEQFIFCEPKDSWTLHEELIKNAEEIFKALELPYRIVNICTADIGAIAAKKYDLEVWMPVQNTYREMVSCSNCTDYQARKLNIKYGKEGAAGNHVVHTLNSTAVATSRLMAAILENYQQKDGSIKVPKVLQKHMNDIKVIGKE
jgi:seryl-tRNA synthetase